ncbi:MAG: LacI family DNA-binding transcriptional regulator [Alkalispirochaeta sp.]
MATLKDVAQKAGVSEGTASMVINGKAGPKNKTRELVLQAARELKYVPNSAARNLAKRESTTVGLVVTDIENPFFGSITRYVNHFLGRQEQSMILSVSNDDAKTEDSILANFIQQGVRAIIVAPTQLSRRDTSTFANVHDHGIPIVFISSYYEGFAAPRVLTDYSQGSFELTNYLIDTGHSNIRFLVSHDIKAPIAKERIDGFLRAHNHHSITPHNRAIHRCPHPDYESGYREARRVLEDGKPDAIIAINDVMALGAKRAIKEHGLSVPDDISVAGYDDVVFSSLSEIPLTTVRQNIPEIARAAVDLLFMPDIDINTDVRIAPELVIRKSTRTKR